MRRIGEITDAQADWLEISFCRPKDCETCHACEGGQEATTLRLPRAGHSASVGDLAAVDLPTGTVVKASLLAYALPLAGLLGGMGLGLLIGGSGAQTLMALCGAAGLALCVALVALTERRRRRSEKWQPQLVRILPKSMYAGLAEEASGRSIAGDAAVGPDTGAAGGQAGADHPAEKKGV